MSLVVLLCTFSSMSMSFLRYGLHACIQYSKWGLNIALYRGTINPFSLYVIFLRIIPRIWLPLEAAILHCSDTFILSFIITPKSFSFTVLHRIVPPISQFTPVFPCLACRHLHFWKLNNICHVSDHLTNLSISSCSCCLSPFPLIFLKSLVSSANFNILLVTPSSRSLMYIKNKIGPSTDHCGTPLKTGFQFETSPSTTTLCLLSVSHCSIQFIILIPIPWDFNLSISLWCGTLSNAFWKSK